MATRPSPHGTTNRWRTGCHCTACKTAHAADTGERIRARAERRFPARTRRRVLALVTKGASPAEAAAKVDLPVQVLYARCRWDTTWTEALDAALMDGRDPATPHGTATGYRHHRCRCPECRATHHPTQMS